VTPRRLASLTLAGLLSTAAPSAAQNVCTLIYQTGPWTSQGGEGQRVIHASGPLLIRCSAGEELRADSAVLYEAIDEVHLFRRVDYQDPTRALTADQATYNSRSGRLWATGSVVFTDRQRGSTLRGPNLEYFRPGPARPEAQAIATGRPHLTITPADGRGREPMEVDADRISTLGERFVTADGSVVITGGAMEAWAEQAFYDATEERLELRRQARARGERYDLRADFIQTDSEQGALSEVLARGNARLVEERLRVTGPQIRMFFERDSLQRLVSGHSAESTGRSVALARGFRMEADSLDALTPAQRVRQVTAIGTARGEAWDTVRVAGPDPADPAAPDTVAGLALGERDLVLGDTIFGFFGDPAGTAEPAAGDTSPAAADPALERVLAFGNARSLYRLSPSRDEPVVAGARRGINYVIGDTIDLAFAGGDVETATVRGLKRGLYLDPIEPAEPGTPAAGAAGAPAGTGAPLDGRPAPPVNGEGDAPAPPPEPGAPPDAAPPVDDVPPGGA
jgi:lipopolysaccharide export system protein LptA